MAEDLKTGVKMAPQLTMEQYEALLGRVSKIEQGLSPATTLSKKDRATKHTATLMLFSGKPVVLFEDIKSEEKLDKNGELYVVTSNKINIHLQDGDAVKKVDANYKSLMENGTRVLVEINKMDKKEILAPQGNHNEKIWTSPEDPVGMRESGKRFSSELVPLTQTLWKTTAEVTILEGELKGQKLVIDANSLNR